MPDGDEGQGTRTRGKPCGVTGASWAAAVGRLMAIGIKVTLRLVLQSPVVEWGCGRGQAAPLHCCTWTWRWEREFFLEHKILLGRWPLAFGLNPSLDSVTLITPLFPEWVLFLTRSG